MALNVRFGGPVAKSRQSASHPIAALQPAAALPILARVERADDRLAAGIEGVTFHDLRGTFVTLAYRSGASIKEIAEVSGHSERDAEAIIRRHYLAGDAVVTKLERRNVVAPDSVKRGK